MFIKKFHGCLPDREIEAAIAAHSKEEAERKRQKRVDEIHVEKQRLADELARLQGGP